MKQYILDMEAQLRSIENQMKSADDTALETLMKKYSDLNHEFELNNGYAYKSEITGVLKGLALQKKISHLMLILYQADKRHGLHLAGFYYQSLILYFLTSLPTTLIWSL